MLAVIVIDRQCNVVGIIRGCLGTVRVVNPNIEHLISAMGSAIIFPLLVELTK